MRSGFFPSGKADHGMPAGAPLRRAFRFFSPDFAAFVLALAGVLASFWVSTRYFESIPHIEDEMAYVWQARVIAESGRITTPSPVCPNCFLVPFVVDYHGQRFGKYPLGWPALLAIGVKFDARGWVNPLLAGLSVWLIYRLGSRIFNRAAGLLAQFLTVTSPFFLINSGSLLSHPWSLFLSLGFTLAYLDVVSDEPRVPRWMPVTAAGLCLGALALTRPLTAVAVALPFGLHGLVRFARGGAALRRRLAGLGLLAGAVTGLYFLWQYAVTGDALLNPYLLWWPYDKIGFGPGVGASAQGHTPLKAWVQTLFGLGVGSHDLLGWPYLSYIGLPFGLWAARKKVSTWLVAGTAFALVAAYALYWTPAWLLGPRYYYEGLPAVVILTAGGLLWLAGVGKHAGVTFRRFARLWATALAAGLLIAGNLFFYLPLRLGMMYGLYDVKAADLALFKSVEASSLPPTLVIVHVEDKWIGYGRLLDLSDPLFRSKFIFTVSQGPVEDQKVIRTFPDRQVWDFHPDQPVSTGEDGGKQ
ncbi:MAG TPA: hypothetical protein PJ988_06120 [Anaerolinea sp.]|nr:hypothetical protein [Anaerolinea sp.]